MNSLGLGVETHPNHRTIETRIAIFCMIDSAMILELKILNYFR